MEKLFDISEFKNHSLYIKYYSDENGNIINIFTKILKLKTGSDCYNYICISSKSKQIRYSHTRFIWECFKGIMPDNKVIDYKDNNKSNNKIYNLQLINEQRNCKKSAINRDYSFSANNHKNRKK